MWCVINCKDGRQRAFTKINGKFSPFISYPRIIMEDYLGRPLEPDEIVHHIDHDPSNNKLENLELELLEHHVRYHQRKYYDKVVKCVWCGKEFLWTAKSQIYFSDGVCLARYRGYTKAGPFCSRKCSGIYGSYVQNGYCEPIDNSNFLKDLYPDKK